MQTKEDKDIYNKRRYQEKKLEILAKTKEYADANKEKISENKRVHYQRSKEKRRIYCIQKKFGISEEQYVDLMNKQKGCCEICKNSLVFPDSIRGPAVDHNHDTGAIRSLLCTNCNTAIGLLKEDIIIIQSAIDYLRGYDGK